MDLRRTSQQDAAAAANNYANDNNGNDDDDRDDNSGFAGFSDAQLTRLRRFYNSERTGSDRKPIRSDDGDNDHDDDGDDRETPTSFDASQTSFVLASPAVMNNRGSFCEAAHLDSQHQKQQQQPKQQQRPPQQPQQYIPHHGQHRPSAAPSHPSSSLYSHPPASFPSDLSSAAFFSSSSSRSARDPPAVCVSPRSSPSPSRPSSAAFTPTSAADADAMSEETPAFDGPYPLSRDGVADPNSTATLPAATAAAAASLSSSVKMESGSGDASMTGCESRPTFPPSASSSSSSSSAAAAEVVFKGEDMRDGRASPGTSAVPRVTAVAVVAPTDHKVNDGLSSPPPNSGFDSGTKPQHDEGRRTERDAEEEEMLRRQMQNMDVFREHQKQMEEANRMRREMLSAALEAKRRATNAEQQKLQVVQRELQSLDQQLNVDVSILRDKIEGASREYLEAQKEYESAEAEFIRAKMELHKKTEMKERLTEHLCVIIQENEIRKARKLAELMAKLEIDSGEYLDLARSSGVDNSYPQQVLKSLQSGLPTLPFGHSNIVHAGADPNNPARRTTSTPTGSAPVGAAAPCCVPPEVLITPAPPRSSEELGVTNSGGSSSLGDRGSPLPHSVTASPHSRFPLSQLPSRRTSSPGADSGILSTSTSASAVSAGASPGLFSASSPYSPHLPSFDPRATAPIPFPALQTSPPSFASPPCTASSPATAAAKDNARDNRDNVRDNLRDNNNGKESDEDVDVEGASSRNGTPFSAHLHPIPLHHSHHHHHHHHQAPASYGGGGASATESDEPMDTGSSSAQHRRDSGISLAPSSTDRRFSGGDRNHVVEEEDGMEATGDDDDEDDDDDDDDDGESGAIDLSRRNSSSTGLPSSASPPQQQQQQHRQASPQPAASLAARLSPQPQPRSHSHSPRPHNHFNHQHHSRKFPNSPTRSPLPPHSSNAHSPLPPHSPRYKDQHPQQQEQQQQQQQRRREGDERRGSDPSHHPVPPFLLNHLHPGLLPHHPASLNPNAAAWSTQNYLPIPQITTGWNSGSSHQSLASPSTLSTTSSPDSEDGSPSADPDRLSPHSAALLEDAAVRRKYSLQEERLLSVPRHEELEIRRNSTGSAAATAFHLTHHRFFDSALGGGGSGGSGSGGGGGGGADSSHNLFGPPRTSCHSPSSPRPKSPPAGVDINGGVHLTSSSSFDPSRLKVENYHHPHHHHHGTHSPGGAHSPGALSPSGGGVPPWQKQTIQLWQFLRELLMEPQNYSSAIRWVDEQKGIFKIDDSNLVATLWGKRKNRPAMNYDKLSRSIRQYYKKGIIKKTDKSQRLVYQFCQPYRP